MPCPRRRAGYLYRRITERNTRREVIRCLERYLALEILRMITSPPEHSLEQLDIQKASAPGASTSAPSP
ncbi:MAG: hypothetical protein DLM60_02550 [Pseudonocardiales bacterium]|nr:MAG: hypothetical protein DLM60_02550 [Pseudonocardiales bacterium]